MAEKCKLGRKASIYYRLIIFFSLNNLVAVGKDKLYITQWSSFNQWWGYFLEVALMKGSGQVFYYDGKWARSVATGFLFANGINVSPDQL